MFDPRWTCLHSFPCSSSHALLPCSALQHNAAFALYGLSDNEDNLLEFVREGAVQVRRGGYERGACAILADSTEHQY